MWPQVRDTARVLEPQARATAGRPRLFRSARADDHPLSFRESLPHHFARLSIGDTHLYTHGDGLAIAPGDPHTPDLAASGPASGARARQLARALRPPRAASHRGRRHRDARDT